MRLLCVITLFVKVVHTLPLGCELKSDSRTLICEKLPNSAPKLDLRKLIVTQCVESIDFIIRLYQEQNHLLTHFKLVECAKIQAISTTLKSPSSQETSPLSLTEIPIAQTTLSTNSHSDVDTDLGLSTTTVSMMEIEHEQRPPKVGKESQTKGVILTMSVIVLYIIFIKLMLRVFVNE